MQSSPLLGRPAERRKEIVRELRHEIVHGLLPPGSQFPTRTEIESRFGVSPLTVQRALERLRQDGFITVNGRQGTYVAKHPPHLTNFALVFPGQPDGEVWVRFWTALSNEAAQIVLPEKQHLKSYHQIDGHRGNPAFEELAREVQAHRVAGLIFASSPHLLEGTPLLDEPGIPRVAIQSPGKALPYPVIVPDRESFFTQALEYLKKLGRKRIACIGPPQGFELEDAMRSRVEEFGLEYRPYWWLGVSNDAAFVARNCAHLLMNASQHDRPDALIISDDNLAEHAMSGLVAAGVRVPEDLDIVTHCNFPWPTPSVLPCRRLGYDAREVLNACVESVLLVRNGQEAPAVTMVAARFEDEI